MRIEQRLVAARVSQLSDTLVKEAIRNMEGMAFDEMLSGDSGLENVWEEICVQVQKERSIYWETYIETMEALLAGDVELLDADSRLALWTFTASGREYFDDLKNDDEDVSNAPVDDDEIVAILVDGLLSAAARHRTSNISRYLRRHEEGLDGLEDDEEDDRADQ